jgi:hypothetical protein
MNKAHQKIILLVAAVFLLILFRSLRPVIFDSDDEPDSQITVSTELKNISSADIEGIKKEVQVALNSIPQILGIKYWENIKIEIVDKGTCYADGGIVSLSISHIRDNSAPIIHEVVHILTKHKHNSFFSEGLAVYFQERFGGSSGFPNFSVPLDELVRNHENQLLHLSQLKNDNRIFDQVGTELRRIAYLEAGSFFNYLVEKYGEQKLADLHNSESLNYKKVYGKNIQELENDWKSYLFKDYHSIKI